ncbi:GEVED domain-containing protein, partial [Streptococcus sp. ZJ93]|uniref:GEVED domain-containing protein n=1 Tax=Streptococcus handemini TaxID=3161188 RepID=UPI0034D5CDF2
MFKRKKDRFSIRKFKIGVGSVFLGSLLLVAPQVYADTGETVETDPASENTVLELPETKYESNKEKLEPISQESTTPTPMATDSTSISDKITVDKNILLDEIAEFDVLGDSDKYRYASNKNAYDRELSNAKAILQKEEATQEETNQATAKLAEARQALDGVAPVEEVERVAATIYKVTYTDQETGKEVYATSHSVAEKTTLSIEQPKEFHVTVDAKTDLKIQPALQGYKLATDQAEAQAAVVAERGGRKNLVNFNIVRDNQVAADNNETGGYTGFRALPKEKTVGEYNYASGGDAAGNQTFKDESKKDHENLKKQITWLDWGDDKSAHNLKTLSNGDKALQVGSYFEKELFPGYVIRVEVTGLKPFQASDIYKKRVEGTDAEGTYDPNAFNSPISNKDVHKEIVVKQQSMLWSSARKLGIDAGAKPVVTFNDDGINMGVQFKLSATYLNRKVAANILMATGEEAGAREVEMYTANGKPFELLGELSNEKTQGSYYPLSYNSALLALKNGAEDAARRNNTTPVAIHPAYIGNVNPEASRITVAGLASEGNIVYGDGIGTNIFGPVRTNQDNRSLPIVISRNASEAAVYMITEGQQGLMLGVVPFDEGDAPASYGEASHLISDKVSQPYLGSVKADLDIAAEDAPKEKFKTDDLFNTSDEGARQLVGDDELHVTSSGEETYKLHKAAEKTYTLRIKASPNQNPTAYAYAWADFNNNGKFDDGERSELVTVTGENQYDLTWTNVPQMADPSVTKVAVRARIALNQYDIEKPTGIAYTGEVEDFEVQVTHPPRGDKEGTSGYVGEEQSMNIEFKVGGANPVKDSSGNGRIEFTAYGRREYDFDKDNLIEDNQQVKIIDPEGNSVDTWTEPGQGTYTVDGKKITFTPEATFIGKAKGVVLRVTDKNGVHTGWTADKSNASGTTLENVNDGSHTWKTPSMDAVYIPTVINNKPKGIPAETEGPQGVAQTTDANAMFKEYTTDDQGEPTNTVTDKEKLNPASLTLLDASGQKTKTVTVDGQGTYTLGDNGVITFQPLPSYTGTATPVKVQIADASDDTAETTYTPTVKPITPTAAESTTSNIQGAVQTSPIVFGDDSHPNSVNFKSGAESAPIDKSAVTLLNAGGEPAESVEVTDPTTGKKIGTYTLEGESVVFTPEKDFVGEAPAVTLQAKDANGTPVTTTYTPTVTAVEPTGAPAVSTGKQGQPQEGTPTFKGGNPGVPVNVSAENPAKFIDPVTNQPIDGTELPAMKDGEIVGKYTIDKETGKVTFTPNKDFVGTPDPITVEAKDANGTPAKAKYTPTVTPVAPTADPSTTSNIQGAVQTSPIVFGDDSQPNSVNFKSGDAVAPIDQSTVTLLNAEGKPAESVEVTDGTGKKVGAYTLKDGSVVFTPEKDFVGEAPAITLQAKDANGTPVTTTYTPTVTPVTPTGKDKTSTGKQGQTQEGTPTFTEGDPAVPVEISESNPAKFVDPVTKQPIDGTELPAMKDGKIVGKYTIDLTTGKVTFTPDKDFVGTPDPVTVQAKDANGTPAEATYTPTVTPVVPTAEPSATTGIQGAKQSSPIVFEKDDTAKSVNFKDSDPDVKVDPESVTLLDADGNPAESVTVTKDGKPVGTYTIENGAVVFTPEKDFVGEAPAVTIQAKDANGTPVKTTYEPTVTPVKPTAENAESTGKQGQTQEGTPTFTEGDPAIPMSNEPAKLIDPKTGEEVTSVTIPGEGTYTVDPTGKVTFTPEKSFTGKGTGVTVKRTDENGTPVTAKYTPAVTPVTPTGTPAESTGKQGQTQEGTPTFTEGDPEVPMSDDPAKLIDPKTGEEVTSITIPGEGTYTVDPTGKVTFTPEKSFTGKGTGVTVKRTDENGTPVTGKYTPTVTPVTPTGDNDTSTGKQGEKQEGTPTFKNGDGTPLVPDATNPAKLIDPKTGEEVTSVTIPGEGTYTVDPTGKVTFTPEKDFTGTGTGVTVVAKDKNGTPAKGVYTPGVIPNTPPTGESPTVTVPQGSTPISDKDLIASVIPNDKEDGKDVTVTIKNN